MAAPAEVGLVTWSINDKCPHCGHRAALHSGPGATACAPGICHDGPAGDRCSCPGWHPELLVTDRIAEIRARMDSESWVSDDFIAHAPADIAWLLDEVERLRGAE